MVKYKLKFVNPRTLKLGAQFESVWYDWRPYEKRSKEAREDYDKLHESLKQSGKMENPLIVYDNCVLIGMRRCEIAILLKWEFVPIWDIITDIRKDPKPDRVLKLRNKYNSVDY